MSQTSSLNILSGRVGPATGADGTFQYERLDKELATVIAQLRGKYAESCERQLLFAACVPATGTWPGTSVGTVAALDVHNQLSSGVRLEVCKVGAAYISGTLGAGFLAHGLVHTQGATVPTGGTAIVPVCCSAGKSALATWTAGFGRTVAATPSLLWPFLTVLPELATTANPMQFVTEDIDGAISIEPGGVYVITGAATAGTSALISLGVLLRQRPLF